MEKPQSFKAKISDQVVAIGKSNIPSDEKDVLRLLFNRWQAQDGPIMQKEISELLPRIGGHPKYDSRHEETTLRKIRQVVRDLRTLRWAPILADNRGYWIPQTEKECKDYIDRVEKEVKARVVASFETYRAMKESIGISSDYLDRQARLLNFPGSDTAESNTFKGKHYTQYNVPGQGWICNCPGFRYRKTCRHVKEAALKTS